VDRPNLAFPSRQRLRWAPPGLLFRSTGFPPSGQRDHWSSPPAVPHPAHASPSPSPSASWEARAERIGMISRWGPCQERLKSRKPREIRPCVLCSSKLGSGPRRRTGWCGGPSLLRPPGAVTARQISPPGFLVWTGSEPSQSQADTVRDARGQRGTRREVGSLDRPARRREWQHDPAIPPPSAQPPALRAE
jgi:hypothetical protein